MVNPTKAKLGSIRSRLVKGQLIIRRAFTPVDFGWNGRERPATVACNCDFKKPFKFGLTHVLVCCRIFNVEIVFRDKKWELKGSIVARDAIKKVGLEPEAVLVVVNEKLVTDDVLLKEGDLVKLVAVVSGGEFRS